MKYIKTFEKQIYFKVGDIVKIVKKIKSRPDWKIGDFLEIIAVDNSKSNNNLPYEVVSINTPKTDFFKSSIWVTFDEVEKVTEEEYNAKKYNL